MGEREGDRRGRLTAKCRSHSGSAAGFNGESMSIGASSVAAMVGERQG